MNNELLTETEYFTSWLAFMAVSAVGCGLAGAMAGAIGFPPALIIPAVLPVSWFCWRILVASMVVNKVESRMIRK